jgi:DNA modification methylase
VVLTCKYDLIFTSPPYWGRSGYSEKYKGHDGSQFGTAKEYLDKLLHPLLSNAWARLRVGGT